MEQRDSEVSAIGLAALAALTTGLRPSISKAGFCSEGEEEPVIQV